MINSPEEVENYSRKSIDDSIFMQPMDNRKTKRNDAQLRILDTIKPNAREEKGINESLREQQKLKDKICCLFLQARQYLIGTFPRFCCFALLQAK